MRVRYTPRAFADREAIFEYVDRRNPRAAREIKTFLEKRISELGSLEIRHRVIPKLGVHALWVGRYPYIVYYRVGNDEISILHIRHAARRPWRGEGD
jgi:plasmid stabilization system protein ParE